ncbi:hypothetical protein CMU93_03100 [Elizabethkingia anophelis]|nr:hypothetical protein [Elizabethkingia anophelis]
MKNNLFSKSIVRIPAKSFKFYTSLIKLSPVDIYTTLINDIEFLYALYVASPTLHDEFIKLDKVSFSQNKKMVNTIIKYITRISTRSTPFGHFAGNMVINNNEKNKVHTVIPNSIISHTRLDSNFYQLFYDKIVDNIGEKENYKLYSNTSIYDFGKKYRYVEYIIDKESGRRQYFISETDRNEILSLIIKYCKKGASLNNIIETIQKFGYEEAEAKEYIIELVSSQLLVSELTPSSLGSELEIELNNKISIYTPNHLKNFISSIKAIDKKDLTDSYKYFIELQSNLSKEFPGKKDSSFFHKEINISCENIDLSFEEEKNIKDAIDALQFLGNDLNIGETRLSRFVEAYKNRYEDSIQKLTDVLDIEYGIGYGKFLNSGGSNDDPFIKNLSSKAIRKNSQNIDLNNKTSFLLEKIKYALRNNIHSIPVDEEIIKNKSYDFNNIAPAITLFCEFYVDKSNQRWIHPKGLSNSPNHLLGRFTIGNSKINELAREIANYEDSHYSDFLCVEIDYIPESRLGNVVLRNRIRNNSLSYLGGVVSNVDINDLYITLTNGKVNIVTKENKNIMPFYSNAFNTHHDSNLPIFEFLSDLRMQYEYNSFKNVDINAYHIFFDYIPRITYKNVIIKKASWYISLNGEELLELKQNSISFLERKIKNWNIPQYVTVGDGDNVLVIDTKQNLSLEILKNEFEKKRSVILTEYLLGSFNSIVQNNNNESFNNEFIICKKNIANNPTRSLIRTKRIKHKREFLPGSEWLFFKISLGNKKVDILLLKVYSILASYMKKGFIKSFFYIKYFEKSFQLRLRIKLDENSSHQKMIYDQICNFLQIHKNNKLIYNFSIDTYNRELTRYGYEKIDKFENIFYLDSVLSIKILKDSMNNNYPIWLYSLEYIYILLNDYFNTMEDGLSYIKLMKDNFDKEFESNKYTTKLINEKYKVYSPLITPLVYNKLQTLNREKLNIEQQIVKQFKEISIKNEKNDIYSFLNSIIHMHIIRVVRNNNRTYEYIIYCFLNKIFATRIALNKQKNAKV